MTRLVWADPKNRQFETGLDRGVLYPRTSEAVPWDGLISVDENGADAADVYYLEGRPYLVVPKPKEYEAAIKAYTYPDEFSAKMGWAEATDGMYLDSQQSDIFDLSYRTLVGNMMQGTNFGYKIHLVYNATVSSDGASYETLNDSVNPTDLSWKIQTVPVNLEGFRPTAHIVIDTRHLSPDILAQIETLIYGTPMSEADVIADIFEYDDDDFLGTTPGAPSSLPDPQVLFDIMNYGTEVTVVDNGDGTWTASGSYKNIVVDADGNFTISNVDATYEDDSVYYFGDTPPPPPPDTPTDPDGGSPGSPGSGDIDGGTPASPGSGDIDGGTP